MKISPGVTQSNERPKVSVIVATYNAATTLQACIDSFVSQTWQEKELIIADGGSSDGTIELLKNNAQHVTFWQSEPDRGVYDAWNKALSHTCGDWICFVGADDYFWSSNVVTKCMQTAIAAYPKIRVVYGQVALLAESGRVVRVIGDPWPQVKDKFRQLNCLPHPGLMCHRSVFEDNGKFDEAYRVSGDYEFLLRELKDHDALHIPNFVTVGMRMGGISSRPRTLKIGYLECRKAQKANGIRRVGGYWIAGYILALARVAVRAMFGDRLENRTANFLRMLRSGGALRANKMNRFPHNGT